MNLRRNLSLRMEGEDVESLKRELRNLGFSIDLYESGFGVSTRDAVLQFQRQQHFRVTGIVDDETAARIDALQPDILDDRNGFVVTGEVLNAERSPLAGALIRLFDQDLRSHEDLGRAKTDSTGHFEISYNRQNFSRLEKVAADLTFEIENPDGLPVKEYRLFRFQKQKLIQVTYPQIIFNADVKERVKIVLGNESVLGLSEYERNLKEILE